MSSRSCPGWNRMSSSSCSASHRSPTTGKVKCFPFLIFINGIMFSGRKKIIFGGENPAVCVPVSLDHAGIPGTPGLPSWDCHGVSMGRCERCHQEQQLDFCSNTTQSPSLCSKQLLKTLLEALGLSSTASTLREEGATDDSSMGGGSSHPIFREVPAVGSPHPTPHRGQLLPLSQLPPELLPGVQHPWPVLGVTFCAHPPPQGVPNPTPSPMGSAGKGTHSPHPTLLQPPLPDQLSHHLHPPPWKNGRKWDFFPLQKLSLAPLIPFCSPSRAQCPWVNPWEQWVWVSDQLQVLHPSRETHLVFSREELGFLSSAQHLLLPFRDSTGSLRSQDGGFGANS